MIIYKISCEDDLEFMVSDKELEGIKKQIKARVSLINIKTAYVRRDLIRHITFFDDVPVRAQTGDYNYTITDIPEVGFTGGNAK